MKNLFAGVHILSDVCALCMQCISKLPCYQPCVCLVVFGNTRSVHDKGDLKVFVSGFVFLVVDLVGQLTATKSNCMLDFGVSSNTWLFD